jgi:hypothetical protein
LTGNLTQKLRFEAVKASSRISTFASALTHSQEGPIQLPFDSPNVSRPQLDDVIVVVEAIGRDVDLRDETRRVVPRIGRRSAPDFIVTASTSSGVSAHIVDFALSVILTSQAINGKKATYGVASQATATLIVISLVGYRRPAGARAPAGLWGCFRQA